MLGVFKDMVLFDFAYFGYLTLGETRWLMYKGERFFNDETADAALLVFLFASLPFLISSVLITVYSKKEHRTNALGLTTKTVRHKNTTP